MNVNAALRTLIAAALLHSGIHAHAASPVRDTISFLDGILTTACEAGSRSFLGVTVDDILGVIGIESDVRSLLYICDYQSVLRQAERASSGLFVDLNTAGRTLGTNVMNRTLDIISERRRDGSTHNANVDATKNRLEDILADVITDDTGALSIEDYAEAIRAEIEKAGQDAAADLAYNLTNYDTLYATGTREHTMYAALAQNPHALIQYTNEISQTLEIAEQAANVEVAHQAGAIAAQEFADTTGYQDTVVRTLAPADDPTPGTAAQLETRAAAATSTREAINELSRGWADYMRQDAVLTSTVVEGLKASVQQQSLTNLQLKHEADRRFQEQYAQIEQERMTYEAELNSNVNELNEALHAVEEAAINSMSILRPQTIDNEYCATNWCPDALKPSAAP